MKVFSFVLAVVFAIIIIVMLTGCFNAGTRSGGSEYTDTGEKTVPFARMLKSMDWIMAMAVIGLGLSVAAWFNGSKSAIGLALGCIVAMVAIVVMKKYASLIAFLTLSLGVLWCVYSLFIKNKGWAWLQFRPSASEPQAGQLENSCTEE
jgi:hypothetical protein